LSSSAGDGVPASSFALQEPRDLAVDTYGNVFLNARDVVRVLVADEHGVVDGTGQVATIYGAYPRTTFPEAETHCLSGLTLSGPDEITISDSCRDLIIRLQMEHKTPLVAPFKLHGGKK